MTAQNADSLYVSADGLLRFQGGTEPEIVLISVNDPFNCEDFVRTALKVLGQDQAEVHIVWLTERPNWGGFSINSGLIVENMRYARQRATASLERITGLLEREGNTATWEAHEVEDHDAGLATIVRSLDADLLMMPIPEGMRFFAQRRLRKLSKAVQRTIVALGPDEEILLLDPPPSVAAERSRTRQASSANQRRPRRERLTARFQDS